MIFLPRRDQKTHIGSLFAANKGQTHNIVYPPYTPASWQAEALHASQAHIKAIFGGDRAGKSGTAAADIVKRIRQFPYEGELFWVACLTEDKIPPVWKWYKRLLAKEEILWDRIEWRKSQRIPKIVPLIYGSQIEFKTMRSGAGSFSAEQVRAIHLDEDGERVTSEMSEIYTDCCSRIFDCDGYIVVSATPVLGKNWMYHRIHASTDPDIASWIVSVDDNRTISADKKKKQLSRLTKDEIDRRYKGLFTMLSGACFKEFDTNIHCLKEEPYISASWRRIRIIDFGYNHPFYCLWMAQNDDGVLWLYDEHHQNETLLADHARIIYEKTQEHTRSLLHDMSSFRPIEATIADHDAQDRAELESSALGEMAIYTIPAVKHVDIGIQSVNRYLKVDERGRARLYISPRCPVAQSEFETYHYKHVKEGNEVKEVVDKVHDEAPDCGRYGVVYFDVPELSYDIET